MELGEQNWCYTTTTTLTGKKNTRTIVTIKRMRMGSNINEIEDVRVHNCLYDVITYPLFCAFVQRRRSHN